MPIVYLDQNKWIQLGRAAKFPQENPDLSVLLEAVTQEVSAGRLAFPLTATNIYETHKINNAQQRHDLASIQAFLSGGLVFRGRYKRLEEELSGLLRNVYSLAPTPRQQNWFLSDIFSKHFWNRMTKGLQFQFPKT